MKIALLCPTRERVRDQKRLIESLKATTTTLDDICLYFGVDENDPFLNETISFECEWVKVIKIPNEGKFLGLGKIWNLMVKEVSEDIFMMTGDDMVFETNAWDVEILKEFQTIRDNVLMVHCNDGMRGPGNPFPGMKPLAVASFIHRSYYDKLGYYTREEWKHGYHDDWIQDVYTKISRVRYRHDIMVRHLHYSNPTAGVKPDSVSTQLNAAFHEINGNALYRNLDSERVREANELKGLIDRSIKGENMKISIIMPTRGRPDNLKRLFDSLIATVADPARVEISSRIDEDDLVSKEVFDDYINKGFNCRYVVGPRNPERLNPLWNDAWRNATGEIYMMSGDDFVFRTPGWDTVIRSTFARSPDKIIFVFGEDGIQHEALGTHGFIHKNWTNTLGYFVQPHCFVYYFDTWTDELSKKIDRRNYLPNLFFEHMHHSAKKSAHDVLYQTMEKKMGIDDKIWEETAQAREEDAEKLRKFITNFK